MQYRSGVEPRNVGLVVEPLNVGLAIDHLDVVLDRLSGLSVWCQIESRAY